MAANARNPIAHTKDRSEVSGTGKKPWKQKGTGRARHGSTREPQWRHGGTAHGAKVRDYSYVLPKKVKSLAYRIALTESFNNKSLIVLSDLKVEKPMTKKIVEILNNLKLAGIKTLIIVSGKDENLKKSVNNMADAKLLNVSNINCHDLLKYEKILFTKDAILNLEKQL
jgi:large subunit ribosomal protein L4